MTTLVAARVHPTAVVESGARLSPGVVVGPLSFVGTGVELGEGTELLAQATVLGPCRIGRHNRLHPHAVLGGEPQDRSYAGEPTELVVGDENVFREAVTVHRGTRKGGGVTRIGSGCLLMTGVHVAHDCTVGDSVMIASTTSLGGHVVLGSRVVLGGHAALAPFVRVGELAFAAGGAMIERDVPPFVVVAGDRARVRGLNLVGLERAGIPAASREALATAYRVLFRKGTPLALAVRSLPVDLLEDPHVRQLAAWFGQARGR